MEEKSVIECKINVDPYANVTRIFTITKKGWAPGNDDLLVIMSGSSGISIATRASNNGHISLDEDEIYKIIKELGGVISFSKDAKKDFISYWKAKNDNYNSRKEIEEKYEKHFK